MTNVTTQLDKALLVFARHLVDEMRYINYSQEWSHPPLRMLLPKFFDVLNYHPDKLGNILQTAYEHTSPKVMNGNINQLDNKMAEPTKGYELFGKTREYYLDEYEVMGTHDKPTPVINNELAAKLEELRYDIIAIFAELTSAQENEHRTLERICFALSPVYSLVQGVKDVGWDLAEYADCWRTLSASERNNLRQQLVAGVT